MDRSFVIGLTSFAVTAALLAVPVIADAAFDDTRDPVPAVEQHRAAETAPSND